MDLAPAAAPPTSTTSPLPISSSIKSPNSPSDTDPLQSHLHKSLSLSNGVRRRLHPQEPPTMVVCSYKECLKNHAATMGGLALDGCGEFFPSPNSSPLDPTSLKCAACGCHRNFHRREPSSPAVVHHHHLPAIQWTNHNNNNSSSPSSSPSPSSPAASPTPHHSIYPPPPPSSAPHMLLALSEMNHHRPPPPYHSGGGVGGRNSELVMMSSNSSGRKRARTKFTSEQKVKMHDFAERLGWKMVRANEDKVVENFCNEIGVRRNVFKVWMHNNKHRKDKLDGGGGGGGLTTAAAEINGKIFDNNGGHHLHHHHEEQHFDDEGDEDEEDEEEEDELGDDSTTVVNNVVKYDLNGSGGNYSEGGRVRFDTNVFDSKVHVLHASNSAVAGSAMSP